MKIYREYVGVRANSDRSSYPRYASVSGDIEHFQHLKTEKLYVFDMNLSYIVYMCYFWKIDSRELVSFSTLNEFNFNKRDDSQIKDFCVIVFIFYCLNLN